MNTTIRTEITTDCGHGYVVSVSSDEPDEPLVIVSDNDGGDVCLPLSVFRTMVRVIEATTEHKTTNL